MFQSVLQIKFMSQCLTVQKNLIIYPNFTFNRLVHSSLYGQTPNIPPHNCRISQLDWATIFSLDQFRDCSNDLLPHMRRCTRQFFGEDVSHLATLRRAVFINPFLQALKASMTHFIWF